jgi:hypothetical protein
MQRIDIASQCRLAVTARFGCSLIVPMAKGRTVGERSPRVVLPVAADTQAVRAGSN